MLMLSMRIGEDMRREDRMFKYDFHLPDGRYVKVYSVHVGDSVYTKFFVYERDGSVEESYDDPRRAK